MPVKGVRMSENRMTPSGLKARQGCSEISTCIGLASKQHIDCYSSCNIVEEASCAAHYCRAVTELTNELAYCLSMWNRWKQWFVQMHEVLLPVLNNDMASTMSQRE